MSDVDTPPVTTEEQLAPIRGTGGSMLDRWVADDPDLAVKRVETMVQVLEKLRRASIKATYPSDWIIHTTTDQDGAIVKQVGYLQDSGAERAGKVWGIEVGAPAIEREEFPDGSYSYHMVAEAWSKVTGERVDYVEGSRWSGDRFFARKAEAGPDEKVNPTDIRKAAYANLHGRAVRALSGLNGVPIDMLREAGIDVTKVVHVNYERGAKGGQSAGATVGGADATVGFGNSKGKRPAELADADLAWYVKAYSENVADPGKARFAKANQRILDALKAEQERRSRAAAHEEETGTKASGPEAAAPATTRGAKLGEIQTALLEVTGKDQRAVGALIRMITKEWGQERTALSSLTDEEVDKLHRYPKDVLLRLHEHSKAGKGQAAPEAGS